MKHKSRLSFIRRLRLCGCYRKAEFGTAKGRSAPYVIDMRSDVLTKPTPRVLQAMTQASLDDDVFREDRTTLGTAFTGRLELVVELLSQ